MSLVHFDLINLQPCFSQTNTPKFSVKFRQADLAHPTTYQVLADPQLTTCLAGYEVRSYLIMFRPKGKDVEGPFEIKGPMLTNNEIGILNKLKGYPVEISIDQIKVNTPDRIFRTVNSVVLKCEQ